MPFRRSFVVTVPSTEHLDGGLDYEANGWATHTVIDLVGPEGRLALGSQEVTAGQLPTLDRSELSLEAARQGLHLGVRFLTQSSTSFPGCSASLTEHHPADNGPCAHRAADRPPSAHPCTQARHQPPEVVVFEIVVGLQYLQDGLCSVEPTCVVEIGFGHRLLN